MVNPGDRSFSRKENTEFVNGRATSRSINQDENKGFGKPVV